MPNTTPESVVAARIRAAYRVRACAAAVCTGAAIFALGTGAGMAICLNAAWLAAAAALPACALLTLLAHRALTSSRPARLRNALLAALMLLLAVFALAALVSLAKQTMLPHATISYIARTSFLMAALCCAFGGAGVSRLMFALRFVLVLGLAALCALSLRGESASGLFPLLGPGAQQVALAALCMLAGAAPVLLLALPPAELAEIDEATRLGATPGPGFFLWRVLLGGAIGVLLLAALSLGGPYERIAQETSWGQRMLLARASGPRAGGTQTALLILQAAALLLCAAQTMLAGAQALSAALPRLQPFALPVALALCAGLLTALVYTGLETTLRAAPLLSLPAAAAGALCLGRRESP